MFAGNYVMVDVGDIIDCWQTTRDVRSAALLNLVNSIANIVNIVTDLCSFLPTIDFEKL